MEHLLITITAVKAQQFEKLLICSSKIYAFIKRLRIVNFLEKRVIKSLSD